MKSIMESIRGGSGVIGMMFQIVQADYDGEWNQTSVCFYDERNSKGPRNWPWKTIASDKK